MIINLPYIEPIDTEDIPENLEELVEESFSSFLDSRFTPYSLAEEKLQYLDNLRSEYLREENRYRPGEEVIIDLMKDYLEFNVKELDKIPCKGDYLSIAFMEECLEAGFLPFNSNYDPSSTTRDNIAKEVIVRIIKVVVNWEV